MKILLAEDDPIMLKMLGRELGNLGYEVIPVRNGQEAWEVFQAEEIHFLISDWEMPGMDGITLVKKLRGLSTGWYCYVILITAKSEAVHLKQAFEAGADDFISKPFNIEELAVRIKTGERVVNLETEHIKLADTLLESRNKLKTVFDSLTEEIIVVDERHIIESANRPFVENRSLGFKEAIGLSAPNLDPELFNDESQKAIQAVFQNGRPRNYLLRTKGRDGRTQIKDIKCLPISDGLGKIGQVVFSVQDITEERKKTEEIKILNEDLNFAMAQIQSKNDMLEDALRQIRDGQAQMLQSEKMASIGQLAAGVAHEINNPTGFVSSNLKTLEGYSDDLLGLIDRYRRISENLESMAEENSSESVSIVEQLKDIKKNEEAIDIDYLREDLPELILESRDGIDRIKKIVMDLKDFAHPEDERRYTDINDCIESTLNIVRNEIKYKATLEKRYGEVPLLLCYPRQLNQVFMNLLINAAQAIHEQGTIYIETRQEGENVRIGIRDTGSGIPTENLPKIFDPFFTTKPVGKGTGLGLNLVYNIIKKHGGTIQVESELGVGTAFFIDLPINADLAENT